jgi:acyl-CoA hydrolase/GNAT superfamily N-acetyltransferase
MNLKTVYPDKVVDASTAISQIRNGSRVFIGTGCGEPKQLIRALAENLNIQDIMVYQMLSWTFADYIDEPQFLDRFSLKLFFINNPIRQATYAGKIDYIPSFLSQIPRYFDSHRIGLDVALVQVSPPDKHGYCSLGISVDITLAGLQNAKLVIAQINPCMPRTWGDSFVHIDDIDFFVEHEEALVQAPTSYKDRSVINRIGFYVNQLVEDGSTLQVGFGHLPNSILQHLMDKNDLGIHTQLITDDFLPLFIEKVITNRKKSFLTGRAVASLCMGTDSLYQYVNDNPLFYFRSSEFVNDPTVIARNDNLVSISSALEVDLTGQVCSDSMQNLFYSGIGDQVDFLRGSAMSKGGFSIVAFPSTARNGKISRIVPHLGEGAGVATTRGDVDFVVTEYGIAELSGKSIYQRVMELAQIAHPKFREELIDVAKARHYIFSDQLPPIQEDLIFIEGYKSRKTLRNGKIVDFRPLLPSDEFAYRNFFYSLKEETIYFRFFYRMKLFSHEVIQQQWAEVDYRKNMSMIGLVRIGGRQEIVAIGSYADESDSVAEVAFVVREDYQGFGIASYLLAELEKIAKENHFSGFYATVLRENASMIHVFRKRYPNAKIQISGGSDLSIHMDFNDAV